MEIKLVYFSTKIYPLFFIKTNNYHRKTDNKICLLTKRDGGRFPFGWKKEKTILSPMVDYWYRDT